MNKNLYKRKCISIVVATMLATTAGVSMAAPKVTRLTPPSNTVSADATTLSRFLPGQRFDLQATVTADAGTTIIGFEFQVDGVTVNVPTARTSIMSGTGVTVANGFVGSLRAYSNLISGMHTLTVNATQSDGQVATLTGNFEVVGTTAQGKPVKTLFYVG